MIWYTSCIGVDFATNLIPHLLKHYLSLGIPKENFLLVLNSRSECSKGMLRARRMLFEVGMQAQDIWIGEYTSQEKQARVRKLLDEYVKPEDWIVHSDADELHEYSQSLESVATELDLKNINAVQGPLIDRVSEDGILKEVSLDQSIWEQYPVECHVGPKILGLARGKSDIKIKLLMYRGYLRPNRGSGKIDNEFKDLAQYIESDYKIHHFKWTDDVLQRLQSRIFTYKRLKMDWWIESKRFIVYYKKHGRIRLEDVV